MNYRRLCGTFVVAGAMVAAQVPAIATAETPALVIGVDHPDPANQRPDQRRLFEYTDFFSRSVTAHRGELLSYRLFGFHIIAVAKSEAFAKSVQPLGRPDTDDPPSIATGKPKLTLNPVVFFTGSNCGWAQPCDFQGGNDLKISGSPPPPPGPPGPPGPPPPQDWKVLINPNAPLGRYTYFCYIHPGMRGTLQIVPASKPVTTQAENDQRSAVQFAQDKAQAERAERAANVLRFSGEQPGERTYFVKVGISAANNHVAIDEMFPNPFATTPPDPRKQLNLVQGDRVVYEWVDGHNVHSVTFPPDSRFPFSADCDSAFVPPPGAPGPPGPPPSCGNPEEDNEPTADPGNAPSGTQLTSPATVVDSGVRLGRDFGLPTTLRWAVTTGEATAPGGYHFNCNIHDFMEGTLNVAPAPSGDDENGGGGDRAKT